MANERENIYDCFIKISRLQDRIERLKSVAEDLAACHLNEFPNDYEFVKELYWGKYFPLSFFINCCNLSYKEMKSIISSDRAMSFDCFACKSPIRVEYKSITEYKKLLKQKETGNHYFSCAECKRETSRLRESAAKERKRAQLLQEEQILILKSMPYSQYLETNHWKGVRRRALKLSGYRCGVCNSNKDILNVHHKTYERRGQELDGYNIKNDLIVLCEFCHGKFHDKLKEN